MNSPSFDPFTAQGKTHENECIDNWMQISGLANCYIRSADSLVNSALGNHSLLDVHVFSICFLYRHSLELILKDVGWKSHYLLHNEKIYAQDRKKWGVFGSHCLMKLWQRCIGDARKVIGDGFPINSTESHQLKSFLERIERRDPDSYSFRYTFSTDRERTHTTLTNVNISVLREMVHQAYERINAILSLIDCELEHKMEIEHDG